MGEGTASIRDDLRHCASAVNRALGFRGQQRRWCIEIRVSEVEASQRQRSVSGARINWKFTSQRARNELARVLVQFRVDSP
jgi:hypothetical protein